MYTEKRIKVTDHAFKRMKQRFRLYFPKSIVEDNRLFKKTIEHCVMNGVFDYKYTNTPFYRNRDMTRHGFCPVFVTSGPMKFICKEGDVCLKVITVLRIEEEY